MSNLEKTALQLAETFFPHCTNGPDPKTEWAYKLILAALDSLAVESKHSTGRLDLHNAFTSGWCAGYNAKHVEPDWIDEEFVEWLKHFEPQPLEPIAIVKSGTCGCTSCPMYPSIPLDVNSKDLDPEIKAVVQENFWELAGKPAVEPCKYAREFIFQVANVDTDDFLGNAAALVIARDERIRREERERCAWQVDHYVSGRIVEIDDLKAAIMGGKE